MPVSSWSIFIHLLRADDKSQDVWRPKCGAPTVNDGPSEIAGSELLEYWMFGASNCGGAYEWRQDQRKPIHNLTSLYLMQGAEVNAGNLVRVWMRVPP